MTVTVHPGKISGSISSIPSKSHLHRLLICSALADKQTIVKHGKTDAEDIIATIKCLEALGAKIEPQETGSLVTPINLKKLPNTCTLPCNESGSTLRFMLPIVCALGIKGTFQMAGRLPERPMAPLDTELERHGIKLTKPSQNTLCCKGRLVSGDYVLPGDVSSQYITGLLLALPLINAPFTLTVKEPIESEDYINLTLQVRESFGIKETGKIYKQSGEFISPQTITAEGDWSNAAFWLCAGAMPFGNINLQEMNKNSTQGDKEICTILQQMGANVSWSQNTVSVKEKKRKGITIDARPIPDLIPVLAAVAAVSEGVTTFTNAARLRLKESDRLKTTAETLQILGANIKETNDGLIVEGKQELTGGTVDAFGDHRIAMMAAIASSACKNPVIITNANAVNKSYPKFWADLVKLGKRVDINEQHMEE